MVGLMRKILLKKVKSLQNRKIKFKLRSSAKRLEKPREWKLETWSHQNRTVEISFQTRGRREHLWLGPRLVYYCQHPLQVVVLTKAVTCISWEIEALKASCRYFPPSFGIPSKTWMFMSFMGNQLLTKGLQYCHNNQHFNLFFLVLNFHLKRQFTSL